MLNGALFEWIFRGESGVTEALTVSPQWRFILFGLGTIQYARHPEGLVENGKRQAARRTEAIAGGGGSGAGDGDDDVRADTEPETGRSELMTAALQATDIRKTFSGIVAARRPRPHGRGGGAGRPDRPQRRRQDDVLQLRARRAPPRLRARASSTARTSAACGCTERAQPWHRAHVPAHRALRRARRVREHLLIAERTRRGDGRLWKDLIGRGQAARRRDRALRRGARAARARRRRRRSRSSTSASARAGSSRSAGR